MTRYLALLFCTLLMKATGEEGLRAHSHAQPGPLQRLALVSPLLTSSFSVLPMSMRSSTYLRGTHEKSADT